MTVLIDNQLSLLIELLTPYVNVVGFEGRTSDASSVAALRDQIIHHGAEAIVVRSTTNVGNALLDGTRVRFVVTATAGVDHVDIAYLAQRGIEFASAQGSNANAVADYVMLAIDVWRDSAGKSPTDLTIGIVGYGNIGRRLAHHAGTAGMRVLVCDPPHATSIENVDSQQSFVDLRTLVVASDIVSLHVPLTRTGVHATANLFDSTYISAMNAGALLVNTSRGGIVDESALKDRLETRGIESVLDVYNNEPAIDVLVASAALISTPHIAGYTIESRTNITRSAGKALLHWLGVSFSDFERALSMASPSGFNERNLVEETAIMRDALRNKSAIDVFDMLRKSHVLRNERLCDPYADNKIGLPVTYRVEKKLLLSIVILRSRKHTDHRGYFQELIRTDKLAAHGIPTTFLQVNHSRSVKGVIRGLHAQLRPPQGKLLHVVRGAIQLVELDIRPSSPTFGQHISIEVSDENGRIVWIPPGFANGFCAVSEFADVVYHCTELYNVQGELSVQALDPALGIEWCEAPSVLSLKDVAAPTLAELTELLRSLE